MTQEQLREKTKKTSEKMKPALANIDLSTQKSEMGKSMDQDKERVAASPTGVQMGQTTKAPQGKLNTLSGTPPAQQAQKPTSGVNNMDKVKSDLRKEQERRGKEAVDALRGSKSVSKQTNTITQQTSSPLNTSPLPTTRGAAGVGGSRKRRKRLTKKKSRKYKR
jgi:hypothetical protein